jgi:pyruvate kinase
LRNPAVTDANGWTRRPAEIGGEPSEVRKPVSVDDQAWLDGGKIGAKFKPWGKLPPSADRSGARSARGQGINFPDFPLALPALTDKDRQGLTAVVRHAAAVGPSFEETARNVLELQEGIWRACKRQSTRRNHLENRDLIKLFNPCRSGDGQPCKAQRGAMIVRGGLAVGFRHERLADA